MLETKKSAQPDEELHAFEPSAERAGFLDQRMRLRLADSLRYILSQANGHLDVPRERFQKFLFQLETDVLQLRQGDRIPCQAHELIFKGRRHVRIA